MAPHSSTLAWKIPWAEEPGRLQSMGLLGVGHNGATSLSRIGKGNGNPLQCSCLENPRDGGAWWGAVYVVAQSRTRLKRLGSSSSNYSRRAPRKPSALRKLGKMHTESWRSRETSQASLGLSAPEAEVRRRSDSGRSGCVTWES